MGPKHIRSPTTDSIAVLRAPGAARLWCAGLGINVVRWLEMLAFSLYALQATGSPLLVAMMTFARMLPMLLLSVPVTGLIEGRDRRRVLMAALFLVAAVEAGLLLAALTDRLTIGLLLLGSLLGGVFWTVEAPLRRIMLAEAGGVATAATSMGVEIALNQLTRMLGAVAGGLMIGLLGLRGVFATGLLLYGLSLLLVAGVPRPERLRPVVGMGVGALLDGVRRVRQDRLLSATVLVTIIFNLFAFPYVALAPVIGERVLHLSSVGIGLLMGVEAGAGVVGAGLVAFLARDEHYRRIYIAGPILFVLGTLGLALAPTAGIAASFLVLSGLGIAGFSAMQMVIPLLAAPPEPPRPRGRRDLDERRRGALRLPARRPSGRGVGRQRGADPHLAGGPRHDGADPPALSRAAEPGPAGTGRSDRSQRHRPEAGARQGSSGPGAPHLNGSGGCFVSALLRPLPQPPRWPWPVPCS